MFIAIDIGNTHTVIGTYDSNTWIQDERIASTLQPAEIERRISSFLNTIKTKQTHLDGIGISSVVPHLTDLFSITIKKYLGIIPLSIRSTLDLGITIHYDDPPSLGTDRICAAIAGFAKFGGPLIIIDCGTATTYNAVGSNGDFLGGAISPGIETSAAALHTRTMQLPMINLDLPANAINTTTITAIQAGVLYGAIDAIERMIVRMREELLRKEKVQAKIIATGGFSKFLSMHSRSIHYIEPTLVLEGIRLIYKRVNNL